VLELACGRGAWTSQLLRHATDVTAVDASPEMLAIAAARAGSERVRFIQADLFAWEPDRRYDVVFFGFWLSHVPPARFEPFWAVVADCLKPQGRVFFADDAYRTPRRARRRTIIPGHPPAAERWHPLPAREGRPPASQPPGAAEANRLEHRGHPHSRAVAVLLGSGTPKLTRPKLRVGAQAPVQHRQRQPFQPLLLSDVGQWR